MEHRQQTRGRRPWWTAAAGLVALLSLVALGVGLTGQSEAPALPAPEQAADPGPAVRPAPGPPVPDRPIEDQPRPRQPPEPAVQGPTLPESAPTSVRIPAIDLRTSPLLSLGLEADGTMEVPDDYDLAGWYRLGPTPGERGPSVIVGHVDSAADGPAVFFRLADLRPGDEVLVDRADGSTAVFVIDRIEQHPKERFPTLSVYGNTDHAALRLVTCGGSFDETTGHYRDNIVAYGRLVGAR